MVSYTGSWHHSFLNFIGVGVTLEVKVPPLLEKVKMDVESREKILGGLLEERNPNLMLV